MIAHWLPAFSHRLHMCTHRAWVPLAAGTCVLWLCRWVLDDVFKCIDFDSDGEICACPDDGPIASVHLLKCLHRMPSVSRASLGPLLV